MEDLISLLELRFYCEIYGEPLRDFKQDFHDHIYVLERCQKSSKCMGNSGTGGWESSLEAIKGTQARNYTALD